MVDLETFRNMALAFPEANEEPHFEKISFRVRKRIFATLDSKNNQACLKLSEKDQDLFCLYDAAVIFPVPNKWGKSGWTFIALDKVPQEMCEDALKLAYGEVSKKR